MHVSYGYSQYYCVVFVIFEHAQLYYVIICFVEKEGHCCLVKKSWFELWVLLQLQHQKIVHFNIIFNGHVKPEEDNI